MTRMALIGRPFLDGEQLVWARARRGPLPPGTSRDDLTAAFSGWQIVDEHAHEGELPRPLKNIAPCWYRLARS